MYIPTPGVYGWIHVRIKPTMAMSPAQLTDASTGESISSFRVPMRYTDASKAEDSEHIRQRYRIRVYRVCMHCLHSVHAVLCKLRTMFHVY